MGGIWGKHVPVREDDRCKVSVVPASKIAPSNPCIYTCVWSLPTSNRADLVTNKSLKKCYFHGWVTKEIAILALLFLRSRV